jgi:hypothetical protein
MKKLEITDWNKPDKNETIDVPDELFSLFNKVAMQIRFHTISGKNEVQTIADIVHGCQKFFKEMYDVNDESPFCPHCHKYKTMQGNGIMHQLCECG